MEPQQIAAGDVVVINDLDHAIEVSHARGHASAAPHQVIGFRREPPDPTPGQPQPWQIFDPIIPATLQPPIAAHVFSLPHAGSLGIDPADLDAHLNSLPPGVPLYVDSRDINMIELQGIERVRDQAARSGRALVIRTVR
jgi:hypothetical protein